MKSSTGRNECYRNIGEVHSGKQVGAKMKFFDNECHVRELLACSFNFNFFFILPHWVGVGGMGLNSEDLFRTSSHSPKTGI